METINGRFLPEDSGNSPRSDEQRPEGNPKLPEENGLGVSGSSGDSAPGHPESGPQPIASETMRPDMFRQARTTRESELAEPEKTMAGVAATGPNSSEPIEIDEASLAEAAKRTIDAACAHDSERYVELGELGRGGWGIVQRALDRQLHREVAVKRIGNPQSLRPGELEQFLHEARITSGLQHPGVVPVHELVAEKDGETYYVMKLLEGVTLRHHIKQAQASCPDGNWNRHLLLEAITPLLLRFIDVCNAVAYAHRCGVIHRDLKPSNIMAGAFGETIVVDWGLARFVDDETEETTFQGPANGMAAGTRSSRPTRGSLNRSRSSTPMESEGSIIGTPTYMAPEQARGELASLGSHSDIYSLGVILYEIVSGTHPHPGMNLQTVLHRARNGMYTPLSETQPYVPKALEAIVNHAMSYEPSQRYEDVETLADDVQAFVTGQTVSVYEESIVERTFRWCSRYRAIAGTVAVATLVLLIVSTTSTLVIRSAHRAERTAKQEAKQAHREALERLVESRDTADTWLVDLSGSLQFHPAMTHLREELISQATSQYERLVSHPIRPLSTNETGRVGETDRATLSLEWLERAKCHIRLGDLNRMAGKAEGSKKHYATAEEILEEIAKTGQTISTVSLNRSKDASDAVTNGMSHQGSLDELIEVEKINALIGVALTDQRPPPTSKIAWARERFAEWLPWEPPKTSDASPSKFIARVISTMVRLETVLGRGSVSDSAASRRAYSEDRINNAIAWAYWLSLSRGEPSDLQLYETVATDHAERFSRLGKHRRAYELWDTLVKELQRRVDVLGERSDWVQAMAHARIRRAEASVGLGKSDAAAQDYVQSIDNLNRGWVLTDSDEFFRHNLATAEFNLASLWSVGDESQRRKAQKLLLRSLDVYRQLLRENATPDILRRLAQVNLSVAEVLNSFEPSIDSEKGIIREHLSEATVAYEILKDQGFLILQDRLDWANTLKLLDDLEKSDKRQETIREIVSDIDPDQLNEQQLLKLQILTTAN